MQRSSKITIQETSHDDFEEKEDVRKAVGQSFHDASYALSIVDTIENAKATQEMAVAMKESVKQLKEQQEQFSLDDMEDVYDDMDDIMMDQRRFKMTWDALWVIWKT